MDTKNPHRDLTDFEIAVRVAVWEAAQNREPITLTAQEAAALHGSILQTGRELSFLRDFRNDVLGCD